MGSIYKITNKLNGKSYIGQTMQLVVKRWRAHISRKSTSAIHAAIKAYGKENFSFEVIEIAPTIEELNMLEQKYIKEFNTMSPNGYNLDMGGRNCIKTKESIEKGAIKKRGKAYKGRRRGIIAIHSESGHEICTEAVKDFLTEGFTKSDLSNIRWVLTRKSGKKRVRGYYFFYNIQANQSLITETKNSVAAQRIGIEPTKVE